MPKFKEMDVTHCRGHLTIHEDYKDFPHNLQDCDLGIQISHDGRLWLCINGISFIRFRPKYEKGEGK